ncbi:MAG: SusD/RagB family nutrient-binding outer membrane lipoprotein, partial [Cyclobacteriaceae bacterium]
MKKIIFSIFLGSMLILPMACDKALDINVNPLRASSADPNAVLPFVLTQFSNRNTTELGTRICDVYQNTSVTFNSPRRGATTSFLTGNTWNMLYVQVLGNLKLVEQDARAAGAARNNITAIALVMKALAFYELTVIWDDVPFTQALDANAFPQPDFDSQETVLKGLIPILDDAVSLIDAIPASGVFTLTGDLIYGGDMSLWKRYAN